MLLYYGVFSRAAIHTWAFTTFAALAFGANKVYPVQHAVSPAAANGLTEIFQVYKPPLVPLASTSSPHDDFSGEACSATLLKYEFVNSYGNPAVAQYAPPPASCEWNTVYFHLYATSKGRQYDRLAFLFLNDTELWRTSTAEPTQNGIYFTYTKDLTHFSTLLSKSGTLILDLGNIVTDVLTGTFTVTLTAHYFNLEVPSQHQPADVVLPVSKMQGSNGQPSIFVLPNDAAKASLSVPNGTKKAILSVIASGNSEEEFWYTNVPDSLVNTFPDTTLLGHSSYREIQVFVDGVMVDAIMPIPAIYTGGINPGLWKPIVCPYAYDLWEADVDITPWVAGKSNALIELRVQGLENSNGGLAIGGGIGQNWYVSARSFFWTDTTATPVDVGKFSLRLPPPTIKYTYDVSGTREAKTATFSVSVERKSIVQRDVGDHLIIWERSQKYSIESMLFANGNNQSLSTNTIVQEGIQKIPVHQVSLSQQKGIRSSGFIMKIDSAYIPYEDKSFFLHGKVNNIYNNQGPESMLLTNTSALFLEFTGDENLGLRGFRDHQYMDDSSSYFSAASGSNKTSWIDGASHQGYRYDIDSGSFLTDRTVQSYERDVRSTYAQVTSDSQSINGVPVAGILSPLLTSNLQHVDIGITEAVCAVRPRRRIQNCASG
ncbi:hypothetical protein DRE_01078 [Drechslerella stenobrocha 248]|uniref:Peptide N-acetyl-beta-D-glucosaminyl asparaginase amidase A N-terminal domain-containing protein n=1 Tax=Drechslerella stenobrocha 248 TaxID=1043628 RepID=W7HW15_9PEZI|nr:hypothetical protein DRE_01078 [Drechslerella stenobrocha 248]